MSNDRPYRGPGSFSDMNRKQKVAQYRLQRMQEVLESSFSDRIYEFEVDFISEVNRRNDTNKLIDTDEPTFTNITDNELTRENIKTITEYTQYSSNDLIFQKAARSITRELGESQEIKDIAFDMVNIYYTDKLNLLQAESRCHYPNSERLQLPATESCVIS